MKVLSIPSYLKKIYGRWELANQAHQLLVEKDWLGCIDLSNQLIELNKNDFFGYYYRGQSKVKLKIFEDAISDLETSLINLKENRFPGIMKDYKLEVELRIANIYRINRQYELALKRIGKLLNDHPEYISGYIEEAGIYYDMEKINASLDSVNRGLERKPKDKELLKLKSSLVYEITTHKE